MTGERTAAALAGYEEAAHMLALVAGSPPDTEPRPRWWRPLARRRHLIEHDNALALWAESVESFADDFVRTEAELDHARRVDERREALR